MRRIEKTIMLVALSVILVTVLFAVILWWGITHPDFHLRVYLPQGVFGNFVLVIGAPLMVLGGFALVSNVAWFLVNIYVAWMFYQVFRSDCKQERRIK